MRAIIDMRKVVLRGSERLIVEITELLGDVPVELLGKATTLGPKGIDPAIDDLHMVLLDMLGRPHRDSSAHPALRPVDGEATTALIPKDKPTA